MKSFERLVLYDQIRNGNGLGNGLITNLAIPLPRDLGPRQTIFQLFEDNPDHDASAFEGRLATANFRVRDDMPAKFDPPVISICLHTCHHTPIMGLAEVDCKLLPSLNLRR